MKKLIFAASFFLTAIIGSSVKADEAALFACIKKYTAIGVSADIALGECKQKSLTGCIQGLIGENFVAQSIKSGSKGHLIDLGNQESRWFEGGAWRDKSCEPFVDGPSRTVGTRNAWDIDTVRQWFRQGWCQQESLEIDQPNTYDDANYLCEMQAYKED